MTSDREFDPSGLPNPICNACRSEITELNQECSGREEGCVSDPNGGFWVVGEYAKRILDRPVDPFYGTVIAKVAP